MQQIKPKIIVAPLNWGIGHATRCVPIINELLSKGFEPIIASDGAALKYLEQEFPEVYSFELPEYDIQYTSKSYFFKLNLLSQFLKIKKAVAEEFKLIQQLIKEENIKGIISDNRFGVYSKDIPSVYITHQINVFSGITTFITSKIHQKLMKNFDEIWIPDNVNSFKLSGELSKNNNLTLKTKYIGLLSRFNQDNTSIQKFEYDILVLLSGIEPQRTILENILIKKLSNSSKKIFFIRGLVGNTQKMDDTNNITFINFVNHHLLKKYILKSELVIARSGYSTIMDLAVLQKKCFFIPTPNQNEQEYLAKHLEQLKVAPFVKQNDFILEKLYKVDDYFGFQNKQDELQVPLNIFRGIEIFL